MVALVLNSIPRIALALAVLLPIALTCDRALKRHARVFYAIAGVLTVAEYWASVLELFVGKALPAWAASYQQTVQGLIDTTNPIGYLIRTAFLSAEAGVVMFTVVMFIGALPKTERVRRLYAVRSEMAILGGIPSFGHGLSRVSTALRYWGGGSSHGTEGLPSWFATMNLIIYGILFVIVFITLTVGWVTSFKVVRHRMRGKAWKRVQRLCAYPFYVLTVVSGALVGFMYTAQGLAQFASAGSKIVVGDLSTFPTRIIQGSGQFWIYVIMAVGYLVLRVGRARADAAQKAARVVR